MKLFLSSEGKDSKTIQDLKSYLDMDISTLKVAFIPTAGNAEGGFGSWRDGKTYKLVQTLFTNLLTIELETTPKQDLISRLKNIDMLWMNGGMAGYLLYWVRRRELDKILPSLLRNGMLYFGSSSGSTICSKTMYSSEWFLEEPEPGVSLIPGLGLIDFEIYPHYRKPLRPEIEKLWEQGELYLLKDGESIIVEDDQIKVLGEKRVIKK